jgi:hypothetical protein
MDSRWYPHFDYAGEPMPRGQFRDPQPTDPDEVAKRNAAIVAIERFCEVQGIDVPPLTETVDIKPLGANARGGVLVTVQFRGTVGERVFGIGYERVLAR